ncbi:MAG TPA: insulinase family protein [Thiopseudomonas sp.]|nr:insulinase family protein [Thiopseudomonas sp.]
MPQTPSLNHPLWQHTLADGCELTVVQAVGAQQCALALSFESGSHHEPFDSLGMAHFLEHLVFRGSHHYGLDDGLMAFIQRNGGQVNAQTQAQQTLFHFQIKSSLFIQAIQRLVDMLVTPLLEPAMLASEREVLHQEFGLYCQAPQILLDAAIAPCLLGTHPLQRFYAGNRVTLGIEDENFAAELAAFHQLAYLRSRLKIVLVVPQQWSHWQDSVLAALQPLTCMSRDQPAQVLPELRVPAGSAVQLCLPVDEAYLALHIPINQSAQGLSELAEKMQHALALSLDQTFLAYAKQHKWCSEISVRAAYSAQDQGVLTLEFKNTTEDHPLLVAAFQQWLSQWRKQMHSAEQQAYEQQAQNNRWCIAEPLRKAQQVLSGCWPLLGISSECLVALDSVLEALAADALVQVIASAAAVEGRYDKGLPMQVERLNRSKADSIAAVSVPQFAFYCGQVSRQLEPDAAPQSSTHALVQQQSLQIPSGLAVCYWGWSVNDPYAVAQRLSGQLAAVSELLSYNAVHWQTECVQNYVFICITGPEEYVAHAVNQMLAVLQLPLTEAALPARGHFALRRLLQRLPRVLAGAKGLDVASEITLLDQPQAALWLGASEHAAVLEQRYVQRLTALNTVVTTAPAATGWEQASASGSDDALLVLYIPLTGENIIEQDRMRVINRVCAQHLQTLLQRYLRTDRALCYAVFVLPYAQGDYEGLVCAVQSSTVSAVQLVEEIKQCLADFQTQLAEYIEMLHADIKRQVEPLEQGALGIEYGRAMLFRHWREQRLEVGVQAETQAAQQICSAEIEQYCQALQQHAQWLLLSNQSATES